MSGREANQRINGRKAPREKGYLFLWTFLLVAIQSPHRSSCFAPSLSTSSASISVSDGIRPRTTHGAQSRRNRQLPEEVSSSAFSSRLRLASASSAADTNAPTSSTARKVAAPKPKSPATSKVSVERKIVSLGKAGKTDQALQLYQSLERPTIRQLNACIDACARARPVRLEQAFHFLQKSVLRPNVYTFGTLMSACARAGQVDKAVQLLATMSTDHGVTPNAVVYNAAVSACARASTPQPETAWRLLDQAAAASIQLTVVGYNAALSAAARAGDCPAALELFGKMLDPEQSTAPAPDQVTYGTILAACEKSRQWRQVLQYADQMQEAGFRLDGLAATSALKACQQLGLASQAVEYLQKMKESANDKPYQRKTAGWQVAGRRPSLRGPDSVAYTLAISACARGGAWQQGIQLLDEYTHNIQTTASQVEVTNSKNTDHAVMMYTAAVTGCEYAGEWKAAFGLLERMRQAGVEPNEATFSSVIGACGTACANMMNSNTNHHHQHHRSSSSANHNNMSKNSENSRDNDAFAATSTETPVPLRKALQLLSVIKKDSTIADPSIQVYNAAIRACAEAMDLQRAMQLLDKVREEGLEPTVITYGSLVTACERVESVDDLSKVFKLMKQDGLDPNEIIYGAAISCCRKAGDAERALLLFRKMLREELRPNVHTFNTVIRAQTENKLRTAKDADRAILVYKILKSQQFSSAYPDRQTYTILIRFLTGNKQPLEAETLLRQMCHDDLIPDVDLYTATVTAYEKTGQPLQALRLMESMRADGYDFYEAPVLNAAFKRAVKLVNVVGRGMTSDSDEDNHPHFTIDVQDGQGEAFVTGENN
jgi:pentatricopeptide repeat domain-containing protein 1